MQRNVSLIALTSTVAILATTYRVSTKWMSSLKNANYFVFRRSALLTSARARQLILKQMKSVGNERDGSLRLGSRRRLNTHGGVSIGEDCNSEGSRCHYFRPKLFVAETWNSMVGRSPEDENLQFGMNYDVDKVCERYGNTLPSLFYMECSSEKGGAEFCIDAESESVVVEGSMNLPKRFTYKHVRKAGGHSVDFALQRLQLYRMTHIQDGRGPQDSTIGAEELMSEIETHQSDGKALSHPLLAIVRDPVQRFVSAAAQAMKDDQQLAQRCLVGGGSIAPTLRCILTEVEQGYAFPTFVPMIADMHCNTRNRNVVFSLYNFEDLPEIIKALGQSDSGAISKLEGSDIPLSSIDELMLFRLCRLYWSDVLMMRSVGYAVSTCPDSMPV